MFLCLRDQHAVSFVQREITRAFVGFSKATLMCVILSYSIFSENESRSIQFGT